MEISELSRERIETYADWYSVSYDRYGVGPEKATPKQQKKLRRMVTVSFGYTFEKSEASDETVNALSDAAFWMLMKSCYDNVQAIGTEKKRNFDRFSEGLNEEAKNAIWCMIENLIFTPVLRKVGNDLEIDVDYGEGYERKLILLNVEGVPEGKFDTFCFAEGNLLPDGDGYKLVGQAENFEDESVMPFAIHFTDAKVSVNINRAEETTFFLNPWHHLRSIGNVILEKANLPGEYLNVQERKLLPVLRELRILGGWGNPEEIHKIELPLLKERAKNHSLEKLVREIEKREKEYPNDKKREHAADTLIDELNRIENETLWRDIFYEVCESQKEYPGMAQTHAPETVAEIRAQIEETLHKQGYTGTYPDFIKVAPIKGIHLADSYNMSYFVGCEKRVAHHIHCTEMWFNDHIAIEFLCGTQRLKKGEEPTDIWTCLFNANGRRFFNSVIYESEYTDESGEVLSDDLGGRIAIAVKKAELKPLTKSERKEVGEFPGWIIFLLVFILMGGLFGLFMTVGFMALTPLLLWLFGEGDSIGELFMMAPWLDMFFMSWLLFGGVMGVITVLAKRK